MTGRPVLVTGGTGFIGSALVRRLVAEGERVRVFDDGSRGRSARLDSVARDVELVSGDVRDVEAVARACAGVERVFHLAAVNGTRFFYTEPERVLDVGIRGTLNVLDGMARRGVGDLLLASSSEVYQTPDRVPTAEDAPLSIPDPLNPRYSYAGSKIASELLALNYGLRCIERVVVFRPHNVYGPDMGWEHVIPELSVRLARADREIDGTARLPIQGTGRETRAFCHIDDLVEGVVLLARSGAHRTIYHLGTEEEVTIETLAREIGRILGRDVQVEPGPPADGGTMRRSPDLGRAKALGYHPKVPLREGLPPTVRWYADHRDEAPNGGR